MIKNSLKAIVCLVVFFPLLAWGAPLNEEEKRDLYSQAKEFFHSGNETAASDSKAAKELYRKAAMRFERIVRDGGIQNGKLFYNIGNAYFRMGNLGQAILNYRRAQKFIPNDPNLRQNLDYARSRRHDQVEEKPQTRVMKTLLFWHYDFSSETRFALFGFFFAAFWLGACVRLFFQRAMPRWAPATGGIIAMIFFGSLIMESVMGKSNIPGVILSKEVIARKGDGESYQPSFKEPIHSGTEFKLIEQREDWHQIELHDGRRCWIAGKDAGLVE